MDFLLTNSAKILYIFGITNIISLLLVLFSCRCMMGIKLFVSLMKYPWYKRFYINHCYYWWVFIISVILHTTFAFVAFGNPF